MFSTSFFINKYSKWLNIGQQYINLLYNFKILPFKKQETYFDPVGRYDLWLLLSRTEAEGVGLATEYTRFRYVLVEENGKFVPGMLNISVVIPNG